MGLFTVNWEMLDPTDTKVGMALQGDASEALELLAQRKTIIEKALERGWTFNAQAPRGNAQPPNRNGQAGSQARTCRHGEMKWKSGTSRKTNKPYKGYFCPANECPPQFIADRAPQRQNYGNEPPEYGEYR